MMVTRLTSHSFLCYPRGCKGCLILCTCLCQTEVQTAYWSVCLYVFRRGTRSIVRIQSYGNIRDSIYSFLQCNISVPDHFPFLIL